MDHNQITLGKGALSGAHSWFLLVLAYLEIFTWCEKISHYKYKVHVTEPKWNLHLWHNYYYFIHTVVNHGKNSWGKNLIITHKMGHSTYLFIGCPQAFFDKHLNGIQVYFVQ